MDMRVDLTGNKRVRASYKGFLIETDQPVDAGGDGSAPEPFDLFLASLGTCAGVYIAYFCEKREIPTAGISLQLAFTRDEAKHLLERIDIEVTLPTGFPERYRAAVIRAAEMCTVKRTLTAPPEIAVTTRLVDTGS